MTEREQVAVTPELVEVVLAAVQNQGVLVGGQALSIWLDAFGLRRYATSAPISIDADFLGDRDLVEAIHQKIPGSTAKLQLRSAISRLIGVVEIPITPDKFMSVDVIERVPPLSVQHVFERAIEMRQDSGQTYLVLHPVDLLTSRAYNLRTFEEKQTENGVEQLRLSLQVVNAYLTSALSDPSNLRAVLRIIEEIVRLAKGPYGAAAKAYGIDFLTAMPLDLIDSDGFQNTRRGQIKLELAKVKCPDYLVETTLAQVPDVDESTGPSESL